MPVPRDGRFVGKRFAFKKVHPHRALVLEFLEELYQQVAEVLPESHAAQQTVATDDKQPLPRKMQFRRHRGRRPKIACGQKVKADRARLRLLPPGSFSDYLNLLNARLDNQRVSLKLFSRAPRTSGLCVSRR